MNELRYKAILELLRQAKEVELACMLEGFYGEEFEALTEKDQADIQEIFDGFKQEIEGRFVKSKVKEIFYKEEK